MSNSVRYLQFESVSRLQYTKFVVDQHWPPLLSDDEMTSLTLSGQLLPVSL